MHWVEKNTNLKKSSMKTNFSSKTQSFLNYIQDIFSLDTRSLAVMRIGIGIVILIDVIIRMYNLTAFHTDLWILPSEIVFSDHAAENVWSLHLISSAYAYQVALFSIHALVALLFIFGWKTRIVSVFIWVLTLSMHGHNPLVLNWGDTFTRVLLFRWMFLPRGQQRSIDNLKRKSPPLSVFSLASVGFICQLAFVYIFSAILKDHARRTSEFTATYYALSLDGFRTTIWARLYQFPEAMKALTAYSRYLESFWLLLLAVPRKKAIFRTICIALFISFHLWLWLTLHLYAFPWIMGLARFALVPSELRDSLINKIKSAWKSLPWFFANTTSLHVKQQFSFLISIFLILSLGYSYMRNLRTTDFNRYDDYFPRDINRFGFMVRLDQFRNMFAPFPFTDNGWIALEWIKSDGTSVDLFHPDQAFSLEEPTNYSQHFRHERWRKYFTSMWLKKNSKYRVHGARYFCHERNSTHLSWDRVESIKRRYMLDRTLEDYEKGEVEEIKIYEAECEV